MNRNRSDGFETPSTEGMVEKANFMIDEFLRDRRKAIHTDTAPLLAEQKISCDMLRLMEIRDKKKIMECECDLKERNKRGGYHMDIPCTMCCLIYQFEKVNSVVRKFLKIHHISKLIDTEVIYLPLSLVSIVAPSQLSLLLERIANIKKGNLPCVENVTECSMKHLSNPMKSERSNEVTIPSTRETIRKVDSTIKKFMKHPSISKLTDIEIAHLPPSLVLKIAPSEITPLMERRGIKDWRYERCIEHYNTGRTQIDGPPPLRMNCLPCRMKYQ